MTSFLTVVHKKVLTTVKVVMVAALLSGCTINVGTTAGSNETNSASNLTVKESSSNEKEIEDYLDKLRALAAREANILEKYDSVTGENYTDDLTLYNTVVDLLPEVRGFISQLEEIMPTDESLAAIHKDYVDGWNLQFKGMTLSAAAVQEQDFSKVAEANDALAQGRALLRSFSQKIASLK